MRDEVVVRVRLLALLAAVAARRPAVADVLDGADALVVVVRREGANELIVADIVDEQIVESLISIGELGSVRNVVSGVVDRELV